MKRNLFSITLCLLLLLSGCSNERVSANDWLLEQDTSCADLQQASISISDLFSLYFIGTIGAADLTTEIDLIITQLHASQAQFIENKKRITPATHSYSSKSGEEALTDAYNITLDFLSAAYNEAYASDGKDLLYIYLAWRDNFITDIATYFTAKGLIEEALQEAAHE